VSIERDGYTVVEGALDAHEVATLREALERQAAVERENGIAARDNRVDDGQRVYNLIAKGSCFAAVAEHPVALRVMEDLLGPAFLLSNLTANIARPDRPERDPARNLHHDVGFVDIAAPRPHEVPPYPIVGQIVWMLDDFTAQNGATRIVPGSHLARRWPSPEDSDRSVPMTGSAGSALFFDGRLWHQTGTNESDSPRHALLAYYCLPWIRPQENWPAVLPEPFASTLTPSLRALLGFEPYVTLGNRHPYPV
jgi:ectoine hydroxylase-related dioxygenase (phytanoyl-CoA dioxygenase family)